MDISEIPKATDLEYDDQFYCNTSELIKIITHNLKKYSKHSVG